MLEILALAPVVLGEIDRFAGPVPLNGPITEAQALLAAIGDKLPPCVAEAGGRGAGMIARFTRGRGDVFCGGSTEWPNALALREPSVEQIMRNALNRFVKRNGFDVESIAASDSLPAADGSFRAWDVHP